jgi:hypothetical protein
MLDAFIGKIYSIVKFFQIECQPKNENYFILFFYLDKCFSPLLNDSRKRFSMKT